MARRYDSKTTTFSPEGRLYQVEYALESINNAPLTLGVVAKDGIVLAGDLGMSSTLLDQTKETEKLFFIDQTLMCAVAGVTSDANILINHARVYAQQYLYSHGEESPIEELVVQIADVKQSYTQFGGLRPFGVSFLFAGYDQYHQYQLYQTDPAGKYTGWKAIAIGQNNQSAQSLLRQEYQNDLSIEDALKLVAKVLVKILGVSTINPDRLEIAALKSPGPGQAPRCGFLEKQKIAEIVRTAQTEEEEAQKAQQQQQHREF